jgi:hypothetical protein
MSDADRPCVERFREFLRFIWMDNTEDEALGQWRHRAHHFPDDAERDLACLDEIVADPPPDVVAMLNDDGWVILSHQPDPQTLLAYTPEEYVRWVSDMAGRFRAVFESERS